MSNVAVETYEIEDSTSEASAMANDAAAMELIEKMGLAGQKRAMNPETLTRIPYRVMEKREMLVYRALCDQSRELTAYDADAIPVRVLHVAAHAKETSMFHSLHVWYPSEARIDDPVLIGVIKKRLYPDDEKYANLTSDVFYMLARWGKTLLPFEQLEAIAVDLLRKKRIGQLLKIQSEVASALAAIKESPDIEELSKAPCFS